MVTGETAAKPMIELRDVSVRRGGVPVLRGIELGVEPGECVGVVGPNGAGKTTLLRLVATLIAPSVGNATVLGAEVGTRSVDEIRSRIGLVGHEAALYPELTLVENLEHLCELSAVDPGLARQNLERTGMGAVADRRADRCSNGMRRRADLARLMCTRPEVVLLDEAHAGLDSDARAIIDHIVSTTTSNNGCAVIVSHEKEAVDTLAGRVIPLDAGKLT
ncbi:MAG: ATP-binding cassette domain-containing protein [Acidimicrobiia bacterium]|nr:ATP-binding cassette domain-containing protein [Acidimicrobiia bacterium]